jgi:hypothetical protein
MPDSEGIADAPREHSSSARAPVVALCVRCADADYLHPSAAMRFLASAALTEIVLPQRSTT